MFKALLKCISWCCATTGHWCHKICRRVYLLYYIQYLEEYKKIKVKKAKKRYVKKRNSTDWLCIQMFCFPILWLIDMLKSLWVNVTTSFVADKYSNYLSLMLKKGTREYQLCTSTLMFILGLLTSILFYYMQTFILQRFDMNTLYFALFILFVCTIAPLVTKYGQAISLLVVPITLTSTARAILISIVLMDVHRIGLANIDDNFDKALRTISCDRQAVGRFISRIDFNFKAGDKESKSEPASFDVTVADQGDFLYTVIAAAKEINACARTAYRHAMYAMNGIVQAAESAATFITNSIRQVLGSDIIRFLSTPTIRIDVFVKFVCELIKEIGKKFAEGFGKLAKMAKKVGTKIKNTILSCVTIKFHANYVFNATTARNTSINKIFGNAKRRFFEHFSWITLLRGVVESVLFLWIVKAFYEIFFVAFTYLMLFLNVGAYDNFLLTQAFFEYDREKQMKGGESLLPLYLYELSLYVPRRGVRLNAREASDTLVSFCADCYLGFYTIYIFAMDVLAFSLVKYVRDISLRVVSDFIEPSIGFVAKTPIIGRMFKKGGKLMSDIKAIREDIIKCSPMASPIAWEIYRKAAVCLTLLILLTLASPYLSRTRSFICEIFFPERKPARAAWLYANIQLQRLITKTIVKLFNPFFGNLVFIKAGEINPLLNDIFKSPLPPKIFFLFRIWPFSWCARMVGLVKGTPTCAKCPKKIDVIKDPRAGIKCPNSFCDTYYCIPCFGAIKRNCVVCRVEMRDDDENASEEADSSDCDDL